MTANRRPRFPLPLLRFWTLRTLPVWGLIALIIFLFQIAICGIVHDNKSVTAFLQFLNILPSFVKTLLGGEMLRAGNIAGLIAIGYQHPLILALYMLFAVGVPTGLLAGEVQQGTMELILSRAATKTHVYICAGLITVTGMFALVLVMFSGTVAATGLYEFGQPVPLHFFFKIAIVGGLLASAVGGIALLAAACFGRGTAVALTVAYLVVNYFVSIIAEWWPRMNFLEPITIFHYVHGPQMFQKSAWPVADMAVLVSILVASTVLGGVIWSRRDLPL
jgi:beta-exotoxin I transport system permease protein